MKAKDIKTLITGGTVLVALALYMIFGEAPPNLQEPETGAVVEQQAGANISPGDAENATGKQLIDVKFVNANDGDTINVILDGEKKRVRLLMIDTPEMNYDKGDPMPYAEDAKEFTLSLLKNAKSVQILFDKGPETDNYDRLLAYVYVDGVMLQESLIENGYAAMRYINKPNNSLEQELRDIQKNAENAKLNIWSVDNYFQKDGFHSEVIKN